MGTNLSFWPLGVAKKYFWPAMRFELCTPALEVQAIEIDIVLNKRNEITKFRLELKFC